MWQNLFIMHYCPASCTTSWNLEYDIQEVVTGLDQSPLLNAPEQIIKFSPHKCRPRSLLTGYRNPCHYPHSKENSWGMSLIPGCLLLPLDQASCHCQAQTLCQYFFLSRVKTHLFSTVFGPPPLPPHQLFLFLSFPFPLPSIPLITCPATDGGRRPQFIGAESFYFWFWFIWRFFVICVVWNCSSSNWWINLHLWAHCRCFHVMRALDVQFLLQTSSVNSWERDFKIVSRIIVSSWHYEELGSFLVFGIFLSFYGTASNVQNEAHTKERG